MNAGGRIVPPIGSHANAWNAAATGAGGFSTSVQVHNAPWVSAFGNANGATTLTLQYSADGTNFYDGPNVILAGSGDFRIDATTGAWWVRLKSSNNVTVTASIQAKD